MSFICACEPHAHCHLGCLPPARSFLPSQFYWVGLSRDAADAAWQYVDGSNVQQVSSNTPYAHWSWNMPTFSFDSAKPTWNCIQVG
jgi:hypothetical protein